jgi:hypothetical protein
MFWSEGKQVYSGYMSEVNAKLSKKKKKKKKNWFILCSRKVSNCQA